MNNDIDSTAEQLMHLMDRMRQLHSGAAPPQEAKISPSQLSLIAYTAANPGCGVRNMAVTLKLATPTVSISVRQLEKAGFMERHPDPRDGRAVQLFLTPKGEAFHQRTLEFRRQKFSNLLTELTPPERDTLLNLLEKAIHQAEIKEHGEIK